MNLKICKYCDNNKWQGDVSERLKGRGRICILKKHKVINIDSCNMYKPCIEELKNRMLYNKYKIDELQSEVAYILELLKIKDMDK